MRRLISLFIVLFAFIYSAKAKDIVFCNEYIPVDNSFVANKLMNTIKGQIPNLTVAKLRQKSKLYFPYIEYCLKVAGLPEDLKYIPIVECGFRNRLTSSAGARGFWQIMPVVARNLGMVVTETYDQRDDPAASTRAACRLLREINTQLKRNTGVSSWVLTAAAYNWGVNNIEKTIRSQGQKNYFKMQLNSETAAYVYKLIAFKELFEYPELYMKDFNANIFSNSSAAEDEDVDVNNLPQGPSVSVAEEFSSIEIVTEKKPVVETQTRFVVAQILNEDGKKFRDGNAIKLELKSDLKLAGNFKRKGNSLIGHGWIIDNRVFIDLGYGHEVEVLDNFQNRGLTIEEAGTNGQFVVLKTEVPIN